MKLDGAALGFSLAIGQVCCSHISRRAADLPNIRTLILHSQDAIQLLTVLPLAAVAFAQCKFSSVINSQLTLLGDDDVAVPKAVSLLSQQEIFLLIDPYELVDGKLDCYVNFYLLEPCSIINGRVER